MKTLERAEGKRRKGREGKGTENNQDMMYACSGPPKRASLFYITNIH